MLTRRGWGLLASALALVLAGRLLGLVEFYILAVVAVALCGAAVAFVRLCRPAVSAERSLHPPRVYAGGSSRVEVEVANTGRWPTAVLGVRDSFDQGQRWARFMVAPLAPRARSRAAYRLPTHERGVFDIGPLEASLGDPFGLATTVAAVVGIAELTVYPHVDVIAPLPPVEGHDPLSGSRRPRALLGTGDDFYALRPYEVGDDLRRVHWASTARVDDLMIRQDEMPWQARSTILLDVRSTVHTPQSLELAVSAAASIHASCLRTRSLCRLVSTDGTDSGFGSGHAHAEAVLERLACMGTTPDDRLAGAVAEMRRSGNGGALAVVTTDRTSQADIEALAGLRARFGAVVLVLIEGSDSRAGAGPPPARPGAPGAFTAVVAPTAGLAFDEAWSRAVGPGSRLAAPRRS